MSCNSNLPYEKVETSCWDEVYKIYKNKKDEYWCYRGESPSDLKDSEKHILLSSIDKSFEFHKIKDYERYEYENQLIREFERKYSLYSDFRCKNNLEVCALMQHHGAPTRLIDWTYSFLIALYFAINNAKDSCIVWAIDGNWLVKENNDLISSLNIAKHSDEDSTRLDNKVFDEFLSKRNIDDCVYAMTPFTLNKRLANQRGLFLCPSNISKTFYDNLKNKIGHYKPLRKIIIKWGINTKERNRIINELFEMNIHQETLFPDIDGFSKSLKNRMASPQSIGIN